MRAKRSHRAPRPLGLVIAAFVLLAPVTASAGALPAGSFIDLVAVWLQGQAEGLSWLTTHSAGPGQVDSALVETPEPADPEPVSCGEQGSTKAFDLGEQGSTKAFDLGEQGSTRS